MSIGVDNDRNTRPQLAARKNEAGGKDAFNCEPRQESDLGDNEVRESGAEIPPSPLFVLRQKSPTKRKNVSFPSGLDNGQTELGGVL